METSGAKECARGLLFDSLQSIVVPPPRAHWSVFASTGCEGILLQLFFFAFGSRMLVSHLSSANAAQSTRSKFSVFLSKKC
jgi:hypothetical protein